MPCAPGDLEESMRPKAAELWDAVRLECGLRAAYAPDASTWANLGGQRGRDPAHLHLHALPMAGDTNSYSGAGAPGDPRVASRGVAEVHAAWPDA